MNSTKILTEDEWNQKFEELRERLDNPSSQNDVMLMDYQEEYLPSKLWKRIRRRVLKRDNKTCTYCGGGATVVHHRSYERDVMEGKADHMLVSLCNACHDYIHFDNRAAEETDRILLEKTPPTDIPEPILDLRRKFAHPPEWPRMNSIKILGNPFHGGSATDRYPPVSARVLENRHAKRNRPSDCVMEAIYRSMNPSVGKFEQIDPAKTKEFVIYPRNDKT